MGDETTTVVTTTEGEEPTPEATAEAAVVVAPAVTPEPPGPSEEDLQRAERLALVEQAQTAHTEGTEHITREEAEAIASGVLWRNAEELAQYAADVRAAEEAAEAEAAAAATTTETVVTTDVPDDKKTRGGIFGKIF